MTSTQRLNHLQQHARTYTVIAFWVLAMISLPIQKWLAGEDILPFGIMLGVALQGAAVIVILSMVWHWRRTALLVGVILLIAWAVEYIGHTTGFPFGGYAYTDIMQPQIGGVPLLVPVAWLMMLPPAWAVAHLLTRHLDGWRGYTAFVVVSALAFTAWDLFLDPQMVAWDLWRWDQPGGYFGIPFSNYAGWLLASLVMTVIASRVAPIRHVPLVPLLVIYGMTWFLESVGLIVFWGLPGAGIVGGVVMGAFLLAAAREALRA